MPLSDLAKQILSEVTPNKQKSKYVFSSFRKAQYFDKDALPKALKKVVKELKWEEPAKPHDLKRTLEATWQNSV